MGCQSLLCSGLQVNRGPSTLQKIPLSSKSIDQTLLSRLVRRHLQTNIHINIGPNIWAPQPSQADTENEPSQPAGAEVRLPSMRNRGTHTEFSHLIDNGFTQAVRVISNTNCLSLPSFWPQKVTLSSLLSGRLVHRIQDQVHTDECKHIRTPQPQSEPQSANTANT